jgi:hypothetical protein
MRYVSTASLAVSYSCFVKKGDARAPVNEFFIQYIILLLLLNKVYGRVISESNGMLLHTITT